MKFAVIGLGSFGTKRAQSIKNSKLANLVAIHDTNKENLEKASKLLDVQALEYSQILNNKNIDVVCVCAPNKFHKQIIIESLKSGKHVFCEKPISRNFQEAQEIYDAAKNSKKTLQVGSNHRFLKVFYMQKN